MESDNFSFPDNEIEVSQDHLITAGIFLEKSGLVLSDQLMDDGVRFLAGEIAKAENSLAKSPPGSKYSIETSAPEQGKAILLLTQKHLSGNITTDLQLVRDEEGLNIVSSFMEAQY